MDNKTEHSEPEAQQKETAARDLLTIDVKNDDVLTILGQPCFVCGGVARILRIGGETIPHKAEAEQAHVVAWLLKIRHIHGAQWKAASIAALQVLIDASIAPKVTQP